MTQEQLGFGFEQMAEQQRTVYLPSTMEEAIPFYRKLIERHHEAMMAADAERVMAIRNEARDLAIKLNDGKLLGISGGPDAPACVLERETAAPTGSVPLWGQLGDFTVTVSGVPVRIEQDGIFGIGAGFGTSLGFEAHAVDYKRPFISNTGYRSFIGSSFELVPGMTVDTVDTRLLEHHLANELNGKLQKIDKSYVEREMVRRHTVETERS